MNKYGLAAVDAVKECLCTPGLSPVEAWESATKRLFGTGTATQVKGCPKGAFLGLCETGIVKGIPVGAYTRSVKNKKYAVDAVNALRQDPDLASDLMALWNLALQGTIKKHNAQMNVVGALWENALLNEVRNENG